MARTLWRQLLPPLLLAALALVTEAASVAAINAAGELVVQNNRDVPVTVYAETNLFEKKLGTVEPLRTVTFQLPRNALRGESVKVLLEPRGQHSLLAQGWISKPGSQLALLIPPTPEQLVKVNADIMAAATPVERSSVNGAQSDDDKAVDESTRNGRRK